MEDLSKAYGSKNVYAMTVITSCNHDYFFLRQGLAKCLTCGNVISI